MFSVDDFNKGKVMIPIDEVELFSYLRNINADSISEIRALIPTLYENNSDDIKHELIDIIGDYELIEYLDLVKSEIKDPTSFNISSAAMVSLYDLKGAEAFEYIKLNCKFENVKEILKFKCLEFIEFETEDSLNEIKSIVLSPDCDYVLQYNVLHIFQRYLNIHSCEKLIEKFRGILHVSKPEYGIYRDIQELLNSKT
jgi:hypothetical protein